jgi:hypothetical protein
VLPPALYLLFIFALVIILSGFGVDGVGGGLGGFFMFWVFFGVLGW